VQHAPQAPILVNVPRHFAFLRAVNVGGRTVRMDRLRAAFQGMGFSGAETFIASGNVIFEAEAARPGVLERRIESGLREALGYDVEVFLRSTSELAEIACREAFPPADVASAHAVYVALVAEVLDDAARERVLAAQTPNDSFSVHGRDVYWLSRVRFSESVFSGPKLDKVLGVKATLRNVKTVRRLAAKYGLA
jgi:uncharacterized protein (DUF1697 family)